MPAWVAQRRTRPRSAVADSGAGAGRSWPPQAAEDRRLGVKLSPARKRTRRKPGLDRPLAGLGDGKLAPCAALARDKQPPARAVRARAAQMASRKRPQLPAAQAQIAKDPEDGVVAPP